jgi:hypothetical protein
MATDSDYLPIALLRLHMQFQGCQVRESDLQGGAGGPKQPPGHAVPLCCNCRCRHFFYVFLSFFK